MGNINYYLYEKYKILHIFGANISVRLMFISRNLLIIFFLIQHEVFYKLLCLYTPIAIGQSTPSKPQQNLEPGCECDN